MINKEFVCGGCHHEFESLMPVCPRCGGTGTRHFRSAPNLSLKGVARRTDKILETQFKRMGISNFSNAGGVNKVSWVSSSSTPSIHGQPQAPIQPIFGGIEQLRQAGFNTAGMTRDGQPYQLPDPSQHSVVLPELGAKVGAMSQSMRDATIIEGRTDAKGNVTHLGGSNGK